MMNETSLELEKIETEFIEALSMLETTAGSDITLMKLKA